MNCRFFAVFAVMTALASGQDELRPALEKTYKTWRQSLKMRSDITWMQVTAKHRQIHVKNRILSEKRRFPAAVFDLPALPPSIEGLKFLGVRRNGPTAKAYYYGKIDFGIGEVESSNLMVLSFIGSTRSWFYDQMEFINLAALGDVRAEFAQGDMRYIDATPELLPNGQIPAVPLEIGNVAVIAKVYVFCPGREVKVQINQTSRHEFVNGQEAELVIGGARMGTNEIQFAVTHLEDKDLKPPMAIRVYLMSEVAGVKPIKAFEYLVEDGMPIKGFGKGQFVVDRSILDQLEGR